MSADDGVLIRKDPETSKWVGQHYFVSDENYPAIDATAPQFPNMESALSYYRDAANATEYGFHIIFDGNGEEFETKLVINDPEPELIKPKPLTPEENEVVEFERELQHLINKFGWDAKCGVPDYILANHLRQQLDDVSILLRLRAHHMGETLWGVKQ